MKEAAVWMDFLVLGMALLPWAVELDSKREGAAGQPCASPLTPARAETEAAPAILPHQAPEL